jgi:hypothetical protein
MKFCQNHWSLIRMYLKCWTRIRLGTSEDSQHCFKPGKYNPSWVPGVSDNFLLLKILEFLRYFILRGVGLRHPPSPPPPMFFFFYKVWWHAATLFDLFLHLSSSHTIFIYTTRRDPLLLNVEPVGLRWSGVTYG